MLKLYKTKNQLFECKIKIEGADKSTAKPRLILYPKGDSRNIFFEGTVENGTCKINIFPNINYSSTGKAVLEVIVENSIIFQPWSSEYEIITEQVKIEEAHVSRSPIGASVKIVEDVKVDDKKLVEKKVQKVQKKIEPKKKKTMNDLLEEAAQMIKDGKENKKDDNKVLLKAYNDSIKSLSKEQLKDMVDFVKNDYTPKPETLVWARKVIGESISVKSKLLMYCNEIKK